MVLELKRSLSYRITAILGGVKMKGREKFQG